MAVKKIMSSESLEKETLNGLTLVDFGAPWCAPCRLQEPILRSLADQFEGKAIIAAVNIEEMHDVAPMLGIRNIPTLILYKNGMEVQRFVGLQSNATLADALEKLCLL